MVKNDLATQPAPGSGSHMSKKPRNLYEPQERTRAQKMRRSRVIFKGQKRGLKVKSKGRNGRNLMIETSGKSLSRAYRAENSTWGEGSQRQREQQLEYSR